MLTHYCLTLEGILATYVPILQKRYTIDILLCSLFLEAMALPMIMVLFKAGATKTDSTLVISTFTFLSTFTSSLRQYSLLTLKTKEKFNGDILKAIKMIWLYFCG